MDLEEQEGRPRPDRGQGARAPASGLPEGLGGALVAALFTQSPFSVGLYDADGRVVAGNPAYERHFGITLAEVPPDYSLFDDPQLLASGMLQHIRRAYAGAHV